MNVQARELCKRRRRRRGDDSWLYIGTLGGGGADLDDLARRLDIPICAVPSMIAAIQVVEINRKPFLVSPRKIFDRMRGRARLAGTKMGDA